VRKALLFRELNWKYVYKEAFNLQRGACSGVMKGDLTEVTILLHVLASSFETRSDASLTGSHQFRSKTPWNWSGNLKNDS
jgi:hypothetical protein